jgi:hypothetical protein
MPWYWTDDLARLLVDKGRLPNQAWLQQPQAIRGEGEPLEMAEKLLAEEADEASLAA